MSAASDSSAPRFPPSLVWLIAVAVICGLTLTTYRPVGRSTYAALDDFEIFYTDVDVEKIFRESGRPLLGLAHRAVSPYIYHLEDLKWLRRISLGGICLLGTLLFSATKPLARDPVSRAMLVIALLCLPSITVLSAWATVWTFPWGAALGLGAGMVAWSAIRGWFVGWRWRCLVLLGMSTAMVLAAMFIYQPSVSWFWVMGLVVVLDSRFTRYRTHRRRVFCLLAVGLLQLVICFAALKLYLLLAVVDPQERTLLLADPVAKLTMLFRVVVPMVLSQWQVVDVTRKPFILMLSGISMAAVVTGLVIRSARILAGQSQGRVKAGPRRLIALWLVAILVMLTLAHIHWLAVDANVKNYRTVTTLAVGVTLLLWHTTFQLARGLMRPEYRNLFIWAVSLGLVTLAVGKARSNLDRYWISPYTTGYQFLVRTLQEELTPEIKRIHLVRQSPEDGIVPPGLIHNFGRPLTEVPWVTQGLVTVALRDLPGEAWTEQPLEITDSLEMIDTAGDTSILVIDMRQLKRFRRMGAAVEPPLIPNAR